VASSACPVASPDFFLPPRHISRALAKHLPESQPAAIAVLLQILAPERASEELIGAGMVAFFYRPHPERTFEPATTWATGQQFDHVGHSC
jgi:hypothetical protein